MKKHTSTRPLSLGGKEKEELLRVRIKPRRRNRITPKAIISAIKGSAGNQTTIATRLMVRRSAVAFIINKRAGEEWDLVRKAYQNECESAIDAAGETVQYLIRQRKDLVEAGKNARWVLEKRRRAEYGDVSKLVLEGGDKAIKSENVINLDVLDTLPVEAKRAILQAIEQNQDKKDQPDKKGKPKKGG